MGSESGPLVRRHCGKGRRRSRALSIDPFPAGRFAFGRGRLTRPKAPSSAPWPYIFGSIVRVASSHSCDPAFAHKHPTLALPASAVASTRPNMKPNRRALVVLARRLGEDLAENDEALDRFSR
jgi:hypothetical protein